MQTKQVDRIDQENGAGNKRNHAGRTHRTQGTERDCDKDQQDNQDFAV